MEKEKVMLQKDGTQLESAGHLSARAMLIFSVTFQTKKEYEITLIQKKGVWYEPTPSR